MVSVSRRTSSIGADSSPEMHSSQNDNALLHQKGGDFVLEDNTAHFRNFNKVMPSRSQDIRLSRNLR
jgi:hypothetical protein